MSIRFEFPILIRNVEPFFGITFILPSDEITKVFLVSNMIRPAVPSSDAFFEARTLNSQPMKGKKLLFGYFFTITFHRILS